MNKLNVLFMASSTNTGLTFNFSRLALALNNLGHHVVVISEPKEQEKGLFKELVNKGLICYAIQGIDTFSTGKTISAARRVGEIIRNHDIEVIHAQSIRQMIVAFVGCKIFHWKKRIGITVSIHSTLHGSSFERAALLIESLLLNACADIAMPVAKSVANKLSAAGLSPKKTFTIYNGIDLKFFDETLLENRQSPILNSGSSSLRLGYFATMVPRKGHKFLLMALSEVTRKHSDISLVLTGDGPLRNKLETLSRSLQIRDKLIFTGEINYQSLYQLIKQIDIVVFPSLAELFPYAILEAMAAGKPIIATRVGGIPEAVMEGVNGHLIKTRDGLELANSIVGLITNPELVRKMGENSRRLVEAKFNLAKVVPDLINCYKLSLSKN